MLTQLTINNFAIVRQLEIELAKGMSVITGGNRRRKIYCY